MTEEKAPPYQPMRVSRIAYNEIRHKMTAFGFEGNIEDVDGTEVLDMRGIGLVMEQDPFVQQPTPPEEPE